MAWLVVPQPRSGVPDLMSVLVNGLLVQNIVGAPSPNTAFWSIAVEVQLYILLPVLLLMIRRRGALAMVAAVTLVVAAVGIVGPHVARLDTFVIQSAPELAALFALGIVSAGIVAAGARRSWPWPWLALAAAAPVFATIAWQGSAWTLRPPVSGSTWRSRRRSPASSSASPPVARRRSCACWTHARSGASAPPPTACT